MRTQREFISTPCTPQSLCWSADALVDWVAGGLRYGLTGGLVDPHVRYGYRFDAAVMTPDGHFAVLYEKLGTKALVLRDGKVLRELQRSYYHADVYEYPVALTTLPSGRTLLAHCPDDYCRIELEDVETGERLTRRDTPSHDVFHSRLQFSRDGRSLLSAGWIWQPVDAAYVFDVTRALEQPASLDTLVDFSLGDSFVEIHSAAFGERDIVVFECEGMDADDGQGARLVVYSLSEARVVSSVPLDEPTGTLMVMGAYALALFQHPRLIELATGRVVERWPELSTGKQCSSVIHHLPALPPLALDPAGGRFAVGTEKGIEVLRFYP